MSLRKPVSFGLIALCALVGLLVLSASALAGLPDNRAFEMVSPVEKGGKSWMPNLAIPDASGEHVIVDGGVVNSVLETGVSWMHETRTATGWSGVQFGPSIGGEGLELSQTRTAFAGVSEDLSRFAFETPMSFDPRDGNGVSPDVYVRDGVAGPLTWASGPPAPAVKIDRLREDNDTVNPDYGAFFAGASADLSDVVWSQFYPLVAPPGSLVGSPPDTHSAGHEVYESVNGVDQQLVGLVPGVGTECGPSHGGCVVPPCGAAMGNASFSHAFAPVAGAVSRAGSQVVFTSPDPQAEAEGVVGCGSPEVYVRQDGGSTVEVSASQRSGGDLSGPQKKVYAGSAEVGGRITTVYFTSKEELTNDANTGAGDEGNDLYAYSLRTGILTDVTPDGDPQDLSGASVVNLVGGAVDGSRVYFTAGGVLAGPDSEGRAPAKGEGADNLYMYEAGSGRTTFVAPGSGVGGAHIGRGGGGVSADVSPDGRHIVFRSSDNVTGYDQRGNPEVYLYDAVSDHLVCVSCNPTGAPPAGPATLPIRPREGGTFGFQVWPGTLPDPRFMSDDGSQVFFDSPDQLTSVVVPAPENETRVETLASAGELVPNVYEYEDGSVHLIAPSARLVAVTPSGNDVFFDTFAQLVPGDRDGSPDIYDARVGGGFPLLAPPACSGTSCQGVPAASPIFATPSSVTFNGVGNFAAPVSGLVESKAKAKQPAKCRKGFVRKRGQCVRRPRAKRSSHDKGGK